ncbi:DNA-processing protein DprA [Roseicyclus persicicus]|uniref:DNA-protecting protein DprA n=1 Tax=Roseicyclus persicicus TaxID=2650661 RepID=A0A7X6JYD1_9RHOB|nr:DNA-processing protein DprA [Roseibacterium persicicum]NKX43678.1 DNA-protecting protein DprA [Roseibacterium persicicum]
MSPETEFGFAESAPASLPPPAADAAERLARLRLIRSRRVGPATYLRLMGEHGDAGAALAALPEVARAAGVEGYSPCPEPVALAELRAATRAGARMICLGDPDYPAPLAGIADAPPVLWARGRASLMARPMLALVGTRNASALGSRMARHLAADLGAAGFVVVSGLARGIDALAHRAALETGTVAVMAGGLDVIYPPENADLARAIAERGLCLSEMPFGLDPQARHFPRRNRIVAGLSRAVIVIEAATRSGSLITARMALDQGREVMAVPGHPLDSRAGGGNLLIRDGALLVRGAEDVIEALGTPGGAPAPARAAPRAEAPVAPAPPAPPPPGGDEAAILDLLGAGPVAEDQLIRDLGRPARAVAQALAVLEMAGRIARGGGGLVTRL